MQLSEVWEVGSNCHGGNWKLCKRRNILLTL
jgi:hypothetical protein